MKKIMFMMMPLFLTALIFGAGCDQDPSTDKDKGSDSPTGGDELIPDVPLHATANGGVLSIDSEGALQVLTLANPPAPTGNSADWYDTKTKTDTVRFNVGEQKGILYVPAPDVAKGEKWPVAVPAGKTLVLAAGENGKIMPYPGSKIIVEGKLLVESGTLIVGDDGTALFGCDILQSGDSTIEEGQIVVSGTLRLYKSSTLSYGNKAVVKSILKGDSSALKDGGIDFRLGSALNLMCAQKQSGYQSRFEIRETDPNGEVFYVTLAQVYANSVYADVSIYQGVLGNDFIIGNTQDSISLNPDRTLYVDGSSYGVPYGANEPFTSNTITIRAGLNYSNIRSELEHNVVTVNGTLEPNRSVYPRDLTIGSEGVYKNGDNQTDIDSSLVVNGEGIFDALNFTEKSAVTVASGGELTIKTPHKFNYSPVIDGILYLNGGGALERGYDISVTGGKLIAGGFILERGSFRAPAPVPSAEPTDPRYAGGRVLINVTDTTPLTSNNGDVVLIGNATLTVDSSLSLSGSAKVIAGSLARTALYNFNESDTNYDALTLQDITLNGAFVLSGSGTDSAQIRAEGNVVFGTPTGPLDNALTGNIVFTHNLAEGTEQTKSFILTGKTLKTEGYKSSLILQGGQLMFGGVTEDTSVSLKGGTYYVTRQDYDTNTSTRFMLGRLGSLNPSDPTEAIGIGIGNGVANSRTDLVLSPTSYIKFALAKSTGKMAYLLAGSVAADRLVSYSYTDGNPAPESGVGTESSLFSIQGTLGANLQGPTIEINNVIIAGSLGNVSAVATNDPVPLFTYDTANLYGTAATGSLTVIHGNPNNRKGGGGGSLTIDHGVTGYFWKYTADGWKGTK